MLSQNQRCRLILKMNMKKRPSIAPLIKKKKQKQNLCVRQIKLKINNTSYEHQGFTYILIFYAVPVSENLPTESKPIPVEENDFAAPEVEKFPEDVYVKEGQTVSLQVGIITCMYIMHVYLGPTLRTRYAKTSIVYNFMI